MNWTEGTTYNMDIKQQMKNKIIWLFTSYIVRILHNHNDKIQVKRLEEKEELEPDTHLEHGGHNRVSLGQEDEVQIKKMRSWNQVKRLEEMEKLDVQESNGLARQESCNCTGTH